MILLEGIYQNSDGTFTFNWQSDLEPNTLIPLKFKKFNKVGSNHYGVKYYIGYKQVSELQKKGFKPIMDDFKEALKNLDKSKIKETDYNQMVSKAIMGFDKFKKLSEFDIIIAPKSSAPLLMDIVSKLKAKAGNISVFSEAFIKNAVENIKVNPKTLPPGDTKKEKSTMSVIRSASKSGTFKMKEVPVQFRRYIVDFLQFNNTTQKQLISKLLKSPNILIVDDIYTGGSTFNEMKRLLDSYISRDNMFAFALLSA